MDYGDYLNELENDDLLVKAKNILNKWETWQLQVFIYDNLKSIDDDEYQDWKLYKKDKYAYYGVSREDFL